MKHLRWGYEFIDKNKRSKRSKYSSIVLILSQRTNFFQNKMTTFYEKYHTQLIHTV